MSIKCGSCKGRHESVAEVRLCAASDVAQERMWDLEIQRRERAEDRRVAEYKMRRDGFDRPRNLDEQRARQASPHGAGCDLERSWGQEKFPEVPAGSYALRDEEGVVKFYQVDRPERGKWAGWTFLSARASDEKWPIKKVDTKHEILSRIAEDPRAAMALYGQELGECGKCHRALTDEESRAIGIGPICREKVEW